MSNIKSPNRAETATGVAQNSEAEATTTNHVVDNKAPTHPHVNSASPDTHQSINTPDACGPHHDAAHKPTVVEKQKQQVKLLTYRRLSTCIVDRNSIKAGTNRPRWRLASALIHNEKCDIDIRHLCDAPAIEVRRWLVGYARLNIEPSSYDPSIIRWNREPLRLPATGRFVELENSLKEARNQQDAARKALANADRVYKALDNVRHLNVVRNLFDNIDRAYISAHCIKKKAQYESKRIQAAIQTIREERRATIADAFYPRNPVS